MAIPEYEGEIPRLTQTQPEFDANNQSWLDYFLTLAPALNEFAGQLNTFSTTASSTTSNTITTLGNKTFTVQAGKSFQVGMSVRASFDSDNYINAEVVSYSGTTLVVNAKSFKGTGTRVSWVIFASQDSLISEPQLVDAAVSLRTLVANLYNGATTVTLDADADFMVIADASDSGNTKKSLLPVASATVKGVSELLTDAEYVTGADTTRTLTASVARTNNLVLATEVATTSGTSHDITGIPSWAKRISVLLNGVSTSGTSDLLIQVIVGTPVATGYNSTSGANSTVVLAPATSTAGFALKVTSNANTQSGINTILKIGTNKYVSSHSLKLANNTTSFGGGDIATSGAITGIRLTTAGGTDTFDAGSFSIIYE